jgi:hypothetical protein
LRRVQESAGRALASRSSPRRRVPFRASGGRFRISVPGWQAETTMSTMVTGIVHEAPAPSDGEATAGAPAFVWLTAAAVVATAVPAFFRLPYSVPGLQSLTPQKILLPLVVLTLAPFLWRRPTGRVLTPLVCAAGGLFLWLLVSVLVNRQYQFVYNVRAWSWLALDFGLLVAAKEMAARPASRRLLGGSVLAAVAIVALIGFFELVNLPGTDGFFFLFRPNWISLGLHGPGPEVVLPVHGFAGAQMALMSTLSNDSGWFLALGSVAFAGLWLLGDLRRPWTTRLGPATVAAGYLASLLALLLTLSRASILGVVGGLVALLGAASVLWPRLRRRALVIALASLCITVGQTFSNPVLRSKFLTLASTDAWTTGMARSTTRAIPPEERSPAVSDRTTTPAAPGTEVPTPAAPVASVPAARAPVPVVPVVTARTTAAPAAPAPTIHGAGTSPPRVDDNAQPRAATAAGETKRGSGIVGAWSVTQRVLMARVALAMVSQNSIFGVGFANFRTRLYEPGQYAAIFEVGDTVADVQDPHNFFLWISAAGGLPALFLVLLILGLSARTVTRAVVRGGEDVGWAVTIGATWLTLAEYMLMGFTLMTPASQAAFALLVGATAAIERGKAPTELPVR